MGKSQDGKGTDDGEKIPAFRNPVDLIAYNMIRASPIKPIQYNETDRLLAKLSTCEKISYLDTKENLALLLPFLNDNEANIKYLSGSETFLTKYCAWLIYPVRGSYVEKRLKIMFSSGIHAHWEAWFRIANPPKLFRHYANWTYPRFNGVSQLTYNSKVVTGFYICGICLVGCLLCLFSELLSTWIAKS